jgi:Mrp family chromosome partitioning ATPase
MSKLYEVLENASREHEKRKTGRSQGAVFEPGYSRTETEMIGLYQAIDRALGRKEERVVQFMGAETEDGCSTVVRDLARAAAIRAGESVLLVDLNQQPGDNQPVVGDVFRHFEQILLDQLPFDTTLHPVEKSNLFVASLSSSPLRPLPAANNTLDIWDRLKERFSLILIDAPPPSSSPIGFSMLDKVDGVVLVIRAEKTRCAAAISLKEKITNEGARIIGAVYNDRRYYIPNWLYKYI